MASPSRTESAPPLTGPAYPPPADGYPPPPGYPPAPGYPSAPAQYALPAGSPSAPPPPAQTVKFGPSGYSGPSPYSSPSGTSVSPSPSSTNWVNEAGLNPRWEQGPAALPLISEDRLDQPRPRRPLVLLLVLLLAAILVVPALLIVHAFHGLGGSRAAAARPTSTTPAPSTSAATSERAAAGALASLLGQSVTDRDTIVNAVGAVNQCTSGLSQAPKAFQDGATGRQKLLQQLAHLPGGSKLPAAMLQDLTGAWQASAAVDTDLGKWSQDEVSHGCHRGDHADVNFAASNTPDVQATNDKAAFVALWNPIAARYGLTHYSTSQL